MRRRGNILVCVFVGVILLKITSQHIALIKDYLNHSHIATVLFVTCENANEMLEILTELHNINSYVNVQSITNESDLSNFNYTHFFVRLESPHAVVINLNCEHVNQVLNESSQRTLFHLARSWLIFSNNMSESYEKLRHENINLDADITLVIPLNHRLID